MTTEPQDLEPIRSRDDLVAPFAAACKSRDSWKIGPEMEKFGLLVGSNRPLPYVGNPGVLNVLEALAERCALHPRYPR